MKYITISMLLLISIASCHESIDAPKYESSEIDFHLQTHNEIDAKRLCLGKLLSKSLEDKAFRNLIKIRSINDSANWNNEILLIKLLNQEIKPNVIFINLINTTLDQLNESCFSNMNEVIEAIYNDPLLVIKIPDIFDPRNWNEEEIIPFVYVNTIQAVDDSIGTSTGSYIGFHASGTIDRYTYGAPWFFPLVLKCSEDYVMFDHKLDLFPNLEIHNYHDFNLVQSISSQAFNDPILVNGADYFILPWNSFLKEINTSSNILQSPFPLDTCHAECPYECIPVNQRKITYKDVFIQSQNKNAEKYEFSQYYRWGSHLILEDNVIPLVLFRHDDKNGNGVWNKTVLGSFPLRSLYDVNVNYVIRNSRYLFGDKLIELPDLSVTINVDGKFTINTESCTLIKNIEADDLLRFTSNRIKIDRIGQEFELPNGDFVLASKFANDVVLNYDPYCLERNDTLGFNSLSLICDY